MMVNAVTVVTVTVMVIVGTVIVEVAVEVIVEMLSHFKIPKRYFKIELFELNESPCRKIKLHFLIIYFNTSHL